MSRLIVSGSQFLDPPLSSGPDVCNLADFSTFGDQLEPYTALGYTEATMGGGDATRILAGLLQYPVAFQLGQRMHYPTISCAAAVAGEPQSAEMTMANGNALSVNSVFASVFVLCSGTTNANVAGYGFSWRTQAVPGVLAMTLIKRDGVGGSSTLVLTSAVVADPQIGDVFFLRRTHDAGVPSNTLVAGRFRPGVFTQDFFTHVDIVAPVINTGVPGFGRINAVASPEIWQVDSWRAILGPP